MRISVPMARMISGSAGKAGLSTEASRSGRLGKHGGGLRGGERRLITLDQRIARGREAVENRSGLHAVIDHQQHEGHEDRDLARIEVEDAGKARLLQLSIDDAA